MRHGIALTKPQTHNKSPKAFNSQGRLGRPVTCWRLPSGPDSVWPQGFRGAGSTRPRALEQARAAEEETARLGPGTSSGPAEPCGESWGFAAGGFLAAAFWSLEFDKYSLAFALELDSASLFSPCTMILDDVT